MNKNLLFFSALVISTFSTTSVWPAAAAEAAETVDPRYAIDFNAGVPDVVAQFKRLANEAKIYVTKIENEYTQFKKDRPEFSHMLARIETAINDLNREINLLNTYRSQKDIRNRRYRDSLHSSLQKYMTAINKLLLIQREIPSAYITILETQYDKYKNGKFPYLAFDIDKILELFRKKEETIQAAADASKDENQKKVLYNLISPYCEAIGRLNEIQQDIAYMEAH